MYRPTIGLEVHAELKTKTKMFCDSRNDPDEARPNVNICPVCMAHPGTLPVINREAVRHILRVGSAVGGKIADYSEFDRKSYFYPDIPKGYQISQYKYPLIVGGELTGVALTRVHLEEDTARSTHLFEKSLIDFNRAGIPLMELVTEPVIPDASTAVRFARELQLLLRTLGASEANLEKGEMRIEANISVSRFDLGDSALRSNLGEAAPLGTKVEIKNLNSFRSVERAIAFEIERQTTLIERGGRVVQETRGWDEAKQETFHQRFKEGSADYRYFPEPDLPKLFLSEIQELSQGIVRASLPELPWERRKRYQLFEMSSEYVEMLVASRQLAELFDQMYTRQPGAYKSIANYICSDIAGLISECGDEGLRNITPEGLAAVISDFMNGLISSRGAKDAITEVFKNGGDLTVVAKQHHQQSDTGELTRIVDKVIAEERKAVSEYEAGKRTALQYLLGQAMRESGWTGNPSELKKLLEEKLG